MAVLKEMVTHLRLPSASSPISQVSPDATAGSQLTLVERYRSRYRPAIDMQGYEAKAVHHCLRR